MLNTILMILTKLGLPLIDMLFKRAEDRALRKKQFIEFMKKYDESVLDNLSLRRKYEQVLEELKK